MKFGGVEYSAEGEELLRALRERWVETDDPDEKSALQNEAAVLHEFHRSFPGDRFPGLIFHDSGWEPPASGDDHRAAPVASVATAEPTSHPETLWDVA